MMKYTDYTIPEEIDAKIPDYFYPALAGELYSIFGYHDLEQVIETYEDGTDDAWPVAETDYFPAAFAMACKKTDMIWLLKYWSCELTFFEAVDFGEIICKRIIDDFSTDRVATKSYYEYADKIVDTYYDQFGDDEEEL